MKILRNRRDKEIEFTDLNSAKVYYTNTLSPIDFDNMLEDCKDKAVEAIRDILNLNMMISNSIDLEDLADTFNAFEMGDFYIDYAVDGEESVIFNKCDYPLYALLQNEYRASVILERGYALIFDRIDLQYYKVRFKLVSENEEAPECSIVKTVSITPTEE